MIERNKENVAKLVDMEFSEMTQEDKDFFIREALRNRHYSMNFATWLVEAKRKFAE